MNIEEISFPSDQHFGDRMSERIGGMALSGFDPSNFWQGETMPEKAEIKKNIIKETLSVLNKRVNTLKSETFDDSLKIYYMVLKVKVLKDGKLFSPIFTGSVQKEDGTTQQTHGNTFVIPIANNVARTIYIVDDGISGAEIASKNRLKYPGYKVEYREYHKQGENFEHIINYKNILSGPTSTETQTSELSKNLQDLLKTLNKIDVQALDPSEVKKTYVYYNNAFAGFKKQFNDVENKLFNSKMDEFVNRLTNIEKQIANPNSISANELKIGRFTELGGKGRVKIMDYDYYFAPDGKGKPSNDKLKVQVLMPTGPKTFLLNVFGDENDMKKLRTRIKKEKVLAEVRKVIREILLEDTNNKKLSKHDSNKYISWNDLDIDTQTDIINNVYDNSPYLEKEWNIWTFKEFIDDAVDTPKLIIKYMSVDNLYNQLEKRGWGISNKQINNLVNILKLHKELDPIIVNGDEFFDGGHRLTAYKLMHKKEIPAIDISPLLKMDWEKWMNGEINF